MSRSGLVLTIGIAAEAVRESGPVVHCVAPRAATSFVAEVLHGVGAQSVVTGTSPDALAAAATADAAVFDLGTLGAEWSDAVIPAVASARQAGVPWVLDVTPLGRTPLRTDRVRNLLVHRPGVVRASLEVMEGVHIEVPDGALVTGPVAGLVRVGEEEFEVPGGADALANIPGVRSAVCALMAACLTVAEPREAALAGAAWVALASERAAERSNGPGSFRVALVDALASVRGDEIAEYLHL